MSTTTLPADLANTVWLYSNAAARYVHEAQAATTEVDLLVREALTHTNDISIIATECFLDLALVEHIRDSGSSLGFFVTHED